MNKLILAAFGLLFTTPMFAVAPLIGDVPDQNIAQGTSTGTLYFVVGDTETAFSSLVVTAVASHPALLPTLTMGGTNAQRTIAVTAASGLTGTATVTLTVTDGEALTASRSFNITVTPANTKPTLTGLQGYQIVSPGQNPAAVGFTVSDAETAAGALNIVASSSNTNLVPNANIALGGSGANRTLQVMPLAGQKGTAVIRLSVTDTLGASAQGEFIFSVFDATSANNGFHQPRGIYLLDSTAGTQINGVRMRDGNIRNLPFVDGYVLRTEWDTLEPTNGVFDFTIIDNIFAKLPAGQKLSLMVASGFLPSWLNTLPGVTTYTAGSPATTLPIPWNATTQARHRSMLAALSNHIVDGVPLRDHPRLAAMDVWIPGLKSGIRSQTAQIRDIPGYSRPVFEGGVLTHLANVTENFPNVPTMIGFWTYTDSTPSPVAWESLRQAILAQHNGINRPRVAFWMENLAANRSAANADPWVGLPTFSFTAPLYNSQNSTPICYQVLGSWSRPFASDHVDNNLNGSPEDGMDYGFTHFQCRYYEHYQADVDFQGYAAEFQRWHDFLAALPATSVSLPGSLAFTTTSYSIGENGGSATITVTRSGSASGAVSVSYSTSNGTATAGSDYTPTSGTLQWLDGDDTSKTFTVPIFNDLAREMDETVSITLSNVNGAILDDAIATLTITNDDPEFTLTASTGGSSIDGTQGVVLTTTLSASGGAGPYTWAIVAGNLPSGVSLLSNGTFGGVPTNTGSFTITAQATDTKGNSDTQTFSITVSSPSQAVFRANIFINTDNTTTLTWPSTIDSWYQVEFSNDLKSWNPVGSANKASTTTMSWTDNGSLTGAPPSSESKRFYRVRNWGLFTVAFSGNNFTYNDTNRTVTGIFIKPAGVGPFPALIINHGTFGTASGFGLQRANEMSPWGLACIAANLTHMAGASEDLQTWGYSPENLARIRACQAVLATRSDVIINRLAMWGHSRGAFASIGAASDFGSDLKALGFSAGGITETADLSQPNIAEASGITTPTIMFHGSTDPIVLSSDSQRLQTLLTSLGVTHTRILYDTSSITPVNNAHNLQNTTFYTAPTTGVLAQWRAWLSLTKVLP